MRADASAPFYTSGTFWTAAGVIVGSLLGAATIWLSFRIAYPKRRILYDVDATALVPQHHSLSQVLELRHNGHVLQNPHLARIHVKNSGTRDIVSENFESGTSFDFNLHVRIVETLGAVSSQRESRIPSIETVGSTLKMKPGRIGRGVLISISLLVEGAPQVSCTHSLINVPVARGIRPNWASRHQLSEAVRETLSAIAVIAGIALLIIAIQAHWITLTFTTK